MDAALFQTTQYKEYLALQIERNQSNFGYKRKLAEHAGCKPSYLSQVLYSKVQLTADHAFGLTRFWNLSEFETEYFLKLVDYARASNSEFLQRMERQLKAMQGKMQKLENRMQEIGVEKVTDPSPLYYSAWYYTFIHVLLSTREKSNLAYLKENCSLPENLIIRVLKQLEQMGFAEKSGKNEWRAGKAHIHISKDSVFAQLHHSHWRNAAQANLPLRIPTDIHYTSVQTIPERKMLQAREILLKALEEVREFANEDGDSDVACIGLDFFQPKSGVVF